MRKELQKLENKLFTVDDVVRLLNVKKPTAYAIISRNSRIVKIGAGIYKITSSERKLEISEELKGLPGQLSGFSVMPCGYDVKIYHIFADEKDFSTIEEKSKIVSLVEPTLNEINILVKKANIREILVIRKMNYKYEKPSFERAFIDLYFEVSREKIPHYDMEEILGRLIREDKLNISLLLRYAQQRKLLDGVKKLLEKFKDNIPEQLLK